MTRVQDIFDVWFDSGTSHWAVLNSYPGLQWPADLYLEGSDQHRGWFQTSLLNSVATRGTAPYKIVLTHGFIVDGDGRKMSKSLGNVISPLDVIAKSGADIIRLWALSVDFTEDHRIGDEILKGVADQYRKLRNTFRYLLGALLIDLSGQHQHQGFQCLAPLRCARHGRGAHQRRHDTGRARAGQGQRGLQSHESGRCV